MGDLITLARDVDEQNYIFSWSVRRLTLLHSSCALPVASPGESSTASKSPEDRVERDVEISSRTAPLLNKGDNPKTRSRQLYLSDEGSYVWQRGQSRFYLDWSGSE